MFRHKCGNVIGSYFRSVCLSVRCLAPKWCILELWLLQVTNRKDNARSRTIQSVCVCVAILPSDGHQNWLKRDVDDAITARSALRKVLFFSLRQTVGFDRPFVKRFALCYQTVVCLSVCLSGCPVCLSVTLVYCGQTVGWIKMKLGVQVGLGHDHIVLDGDPAPCPEKGAEPSPNFRPMSINLFVAKRLDGSRCHLVRRYALAQAALC